MKSHFTLQFPYRVVFRIISCFFIIPSISPLWRRSTSSARWELTTFVMVWFEIKSLKVLRSASFKLKKTFTRNSKLKWKDEKYVLWIMHVFSYFRFSFASITIIRVVIRIFCWPTSWCLLVLVGHNNLFDDLSFRQVFNITQFLSLNFLRFTDASFCNSSLWCCSKSTWIWVPLFSLCWISLCIFRLSCPDCWTLDWTLLFMRRGSLEAYCARTAASFCG